MWILILDFMALEDFKKYLNDTYYGSSTKSIESFIPLLFRLLKDTNPNVQSQAVNSFAPVIRFISSESILKLLNKLSSRNIERNTI